MPWPRHVLRVSLILLLRLSDARDYRDKSVDLVPRTNVMEYMYTPPNTDQTLPVPTAVKAIMAEDIRRQQNPHAHTFLAELDEELRNKNKS